MSVEQYKDFQFRYCWDVDHPNTIRIYVEKRPQHTQHLKPEDIFLHPTLRGSPEFIKFPDDHRVSIFLEAQAVAHEWANRVLGVASGKTALASDSRDSKNNLSTRRG